MRRISIPAGTSFRRYASALSWLVREVLAISPARVAAVLAASVVAVLTRAGAIGVALLYVDARTTGRSLTRFGVPLPTDASLSTIALWALVGGVVALLAAVSGYLAGALSFGLARRWVERAAGPLFAVLAQRVPIALPASLEATGPNRRALNHLLLRDVIAVQRMVALLLRLPVPLLTLLAAGAVLLVLNPWLTSLVAVFASGFLVLLLLLSREVVDQARQRERLQAEAGQGVNHILSWLRARESRPGDAAGWARAYLDEARVLASVTALHHSLLAGSRVEAVRDVFQGAVVAAALLGFAAFASAAQPDWPLLLTYFGAFAYFSASLGSMSRILVDVNRFFPALRRITEFLSANASAPPAAEPADANVWEVRACAPQLAGSAASLLLEPGKRVLYLDPRVAAADDVVALLTPLAGGNTEQAERLRAASFYCGALHAPPAAPLELAASPAEREVAFAVIGSAPRALRISELSQDERVALALAPALARPPARCIVAQQTLASVAGETRARLLAALGRSALLIHAQKLPDPAPDVDAVVVSDGARVIGIGDVAWAEQHRAELPAAETSERDSVVADADEELLE